MATKRLQSPPIRFAELRKRCKTASLSEQKLRDYFQPDDENSKPFAPALKLNTELVELGCARPSPRTIAKLYAEATLAATPAPDLTARRKRVAEARRAPASARARLKLLAEGDSWFNLPLWYPPTSLDFLAADFDVRSIAMWGDELEAMVAAKQYRQPLRSGQFRHFLFSGGGNDVLGSIPTYVKRRRPGDTDPAHAPDYIKPTFSQKIGQMIGLYRTLAADVRDATGGRTVLYVHGYANAIPVKDQKYLGKPLAELGFDPVQHELLCKAVVAHMVGMFNTALQSFAQSTAQVVYVDLRPAMRVGDWHGDEIHPARRGSQNISRLFAAAVGANTPTA